MVIIKKEAFSGGKPVPTFPENASSVRATVPSAEALGIKI
jgi:hypothetical protein